MAAPHRWPIHADHCFMRVCLDAVYGRPWHEAVARPWIRHASEEEVRRAIAIAEEIAARPELLPARNLDSLRLRGRSRTQ